MIKSGLVRRIKEQNQHLYLTDVGKVVDAIFDEIKAALVRRDRVELRGFGAFFVKTRSARPGRNPKNGATVSVPERLHPVFKTGERNAPSTERDRRQRFARCVPHKRVGGAIKQMAGRCP